MLLQLLKRRAGLTLVFVAAAIGVAVTSATGLAAAALAIAIILAGLALLRRWSSGGRTNRGRAGDWPAGERFEFSYAWTAPELPRMDELAQRFAHLGLRQGESERHNRLVFSGGSQVRTRLLGGYFVDVRHLPVEAELSTSDSAQNGARRVRLSVRDTLGLALRDSALEDRYAEAAERIREAVEIGLAEPSTR